MLPKEWRDDGSCFGRSFTTQRHAAYDQLVDQYGNALYGYMYHITQDCQRSEALVGATFLRVVEQMDRYSVSDPPFTIWLYHIAHTLIVDALRATPRNDRAAQRAGALSRIPSQATKELSVEPAELHEALTMLPLDQQEVILLRCVAGMRLDQAGYVLARSKSAVKQLQLRALCAFRDLLM
jgi:RNA polymerase sigma factor (sigma-70 family)